jgi:sporulation protein YlmC with PRC-barrel domain
MTSSRETLHTLKERHLKPLDPAEDIRHRKLVDANGDPLGKIEGLLVDDHDDKVRFLRVQAGGFLGIGTSESLVPVEAITKIDEDVVHVNQTRERIARSPAYEPQIVSDGYFADVYGHYGYTPYWDRDYVYPSFPYYP